MKVAFVMGSDSDLPVVEKGIKTVQDFGVEVVVRVISAHRTPAAAEAFAKTAEDKGYEPYNITVDTPYLYTIRETGGIATNAYVDGRNTSYSANDYYDSNQGLECYQIELGYIKNDLEIITNEKENYINAITDAICNNY